MKLAIPVLAVFLAALPAAGQHRAHSLAAGPAPWAHRADAVPPRVDTIPGPVVPPQAPQGRAGGRVLVRTLAAGGGMAIGAFAGFFAGAAGAIVVSADPLAGIALGGIVGGIGGSALGSAAPELGGACGFGRRLGRGAVGTAAGAGVAYLLVRGDGLGPAGLAIIPLAAALAADC